MRLIDADKLLEPGYTDMFDEPIRFDMVSRNAIDNAPTVNAITIEWLKRLQARYLESECYMSVCVVNEILNLWEKENADNS